ncbi:MAG: peptide ABC transporter substrate-binding protein, partial [Planctomycetales bacterium]
QFGSADRYEVSEDGLTYTFHIRAEAKWSNGDPVTAHDFAWSHMRMLHPETAAEYSYQLYYVTGAKKFNDGEVKVGDAVEVELDSRPKKLQLFPRGEILRGKLVKMDGPKDDPVYTVEIGGKRRRFAKTVLGGGIEKCLWVLLDFAKEVGIHALNDRELQFTLVNPTPYFPKLMAFYPLFPVHRGCVEEHGYPAFTKPDKLVNNGAFRLQFRRIRDRIRLVKSETYWNRDQVKVNVVDALSVSSEHTALNLYLSGKADWITAIPITMIPELQAKYEDQKHKDFNPQPFLAIYFYRVNVTKPPMNNPKVREALNLALDKQRIVDAVVKAGELPALSFVPPGIEGYVPALCGEHDPDRARELLAEAGYPGGEGFPSVEILYNTSDSHRSIAEFIQAEWKKKLGIEIRLKKHAWASFLETTRNLDYAVARAGWTGDYVDPNTFLDMWVSGGANNQTGW